MMAKRHQTGYSNKDKKKGPSGLRQEGKYLSGLITPFGKKMPLGERVVKFLIYIGLRLVVKPSRWKQPKKNFEIIDRTYRRIMSSDFIFIPSSLAMYFIMAFLPVLSMILLVTLIPFPEQQFGNIRDSLIKVLKDFIPGSKEIISSMVSINKLDFAEAAGLATGLITTLLISAWIASSGFSKLIFTQSHLYKFKYVGGFWMNKIKGIVIVVSGSFLLAMALVINILMIRLIENSDLSVYAQTIVTKFYLYIGLLILMFIGLVVFFKYSPRYRIKARHVLPGAAVAAIPTALFFALFGYITTLWSYNGYGPIGVIMYIGASALFLSYFLFVGLIVNVSYYNTFVRKPLVKKRTLSKK